MKKISIGVALFFVCTLIPQIVSGQNYQYPLVDSLIVERENSMASEEIDKIRASTTTFTPLQEAELLYHSAMILYAEGKFEKCAELSKKSLDLIKESPANYDLYYPVVHGYVTSLNMLGNNKDAITECGLAIEKLQSSEHFDSIEIIQLHLKKAQSYSLNSEYEPSSAELEIVKPMIDALTDDKKKTALEKKWLSTKAKLFARTGKMKESIKITTSLLDIAYEEGDTASISTHNNTIALSYFRLGDYGKCKHHVEQSMAVNLVRYGAESTKMLRIYGNMGVVCMKLQDYDTAQEYYNRTYKIIESTRGTENIEMASLVFNLGVSHFQKQEYDEALPKFKESLRLRKKFLGDHHANTAHSTQIIGTTLVAQEKMDEAIPYLKKALEIRQKLGNPQDPELTRVYSNLAICYQYKNEIDKAQTYVDAAYETIGYDHSTPYDFDKLVAPFMFANPLELDIALAVDRYKASKSNDDYAVLDKKAKLVDSIQNYLKFYLDDPGSRMVATAKNILVFDELMNGYFERYVQTKNKDVIEKAFAIFEKSKNTLMYEKIAEESSESTIGMPNEIIDQKFALEDSIAYYEELSQSAEGAELTDILKSVNDAKNAYYAHLNMIKKKYPKFYENVYDFPIVSIDDYSASLSENEATISYFFGNGKTYALFFKNGTYDLVDCGESMVIDSIFPLFSENLEKRNDPDAYIQPAKDLYTILIAPFEIEGVSHLNILADDMLSLIPFEVLINPDNNNFLMESHSISYHYSASLQMQGRKPATTKGQLFAMAPVFEELENNTYYAALLEEDIFRDNLSTLPNSENEVNAIASIFGGKKFTKKEATEAAFKKFAPESHVLHLATHGFVNHNNPDNSRLYFYEDSSNTEDGKLHAFEIVNMNLKADLVTLSACNTGVGTIQEGEGVASIGRAFAYAGCLNQLISLWPANDKSTTTIMENFYKNIDLGDTKAQALHNAKKQYLKSSPEVFKHPYYWSGFVFYGNDTALEIQKANNLPWIWICIGFLGLIIAYFILRKK